MQSKITLGETENVLWNFLWWLTVNFQNMTKEVADSRHPESESRQTNHLLQWLEKKWINRKSGGWIENVWEKSTLGDSWQSKSTSSEVRHTQTFLIPNIILLNWGKQQDTLECVMSTDTGIWPGHWAKVSVVCPEMFYFLCAEMHPHKASFHNTNKEGYIRRGPMWA